MEGVKVQGELRRGCLKREGEINGWSSQLRRGGWQKGSKRMEIENTEISERKYGVCVLSDVVIPPHKRESGVVAGFSCRGDLTGRRCIQEWEVVWAKSQEHQKEVT